MSQSSINTLIGTFSAIGNITGRTIDNSNLICIDTANNRIGINTIDPSYSISIIDTSASTSTTTTNNRIGIYTPTLYFDIAKMPETPSDAIIGQAYIDANGFLKVKMPYMS